MISLHIYRIISLLYTDDNIPQTDPDGGTPAVAGLGEGRGDVRHPVRRHAPHHQEEEGPL